MYMDRTQIKKAEWNWDLGTKEKYTAPHVFHNNEWIQLANTVKWSIHQPYSHLPRQWIPTKIATRAIGLFFLVVSLAASRSSGLPSRSQNSSSSKNKTHRNWRNGSTWLDSSWRTDRTNHICYRVESKWPTTDKKGKERKVSSYLSCCLFDWFPPCSWFWGIILCFVPLPVVSVPYLHRKVKLKPALIFVDRERDAIGRSSWRFLFSFCVKISTLCFLSLFFGWMILVGVVLGSAIKAKTR